jgi:hypothetical protein
MQGLNEDDGPALKSLLASSLLPSLAVLVTEPGSCRAPLGGVARAGVSPRGCAACPLAGHTARAAPVSGPPRPCVPAHLSSTVPLSVLCSTYAAGLVGPRARRPSATAAKRRPCCTSARRSSASPRGFSSPRCQDRSTGHCARRGGRTGRVRSASAARGGVARFAALRGCARRDSPTGFEPVGRAIANPEQDALLPAIALVSLGFAVPPRPMLFPVCRLHPRWRGTLGAHAVPPEHAAY